MNSLYLTQAVNKQKINLVIAYFLCTLKKTFMINGLLVATIFSLVQY